MQQSFGKDELDVFIPQNADSVMEICRLFRCSYYIQQNMLKINFHDYKNKTRFSVDNYDLQNFDGEQNYDMICGKIKS